MTARIVPVLLVLTAACGRGDGSVTILLDAEEAITDGIAAGDDEESIVDGWTVTFSKFEIAIGEIVVGRSTDDLEQRDDTVHLVDLTALPPRGFVLSRFDRLEAGRWDVFRYATVLSPETGLTFVIEAELTKPDGESCPPSEPCRDAPHIDLAFEVPAPTEYGPCEPEDGLAGFTVTEGGSSAVAVTIHGDHLLFSGFPGGAEVVTRRAQWLADADTDGDDHVTRAELEAIPAAMLFDAEHYALGGSPIPVTTAWEFVVAQLQTVGHFQGEGECPWTIRP